ncbi:MAG: thioesterase family protein [Rhodococcus sp.]|nr:thioesterase family protein [Rhodococcus sp. (in: high G+C Gram-positive bacteria)]
MPAPLSDAPFREFTALTSTGEGTYSASIDPIWTIGPKVHGGSMMSLVAAAGRRALFDTATEDRPVADSVQPLAVAANYLSAPDPGEVSLTAIIRKRGKQASFVDVELSQDGRTAVRAAVTLGTPDDAEPEYTVPSSVAELPVSPPENALRIEGEHPMAKIVNVARGCEIWIDPDSAPFLTGKTGEPQVRMWVRPRPGDEQDVDTAALFAIMTGDISAPVTVNRGKFGWAPTVQLTTYLRRQPAPGWLRVMASSTVLGATWFEEDHTVLDSTGAVVVQSRQLAMIPR